MQYFEYRVHSTCPESARGWMTGDCPTHPTPPH